jgi:5-methylcytosine-specific restriction endonuclease McrA
MLAELFTLLLSMIEGLLSRRPGRPEDIRRFYRSVEWKRVRYEVLMRNPRCVICGASAKIGARMNVDHIKPLSQRWDLRLDRRNLQTTCANCNWGKGGRSSQFPG